MSKFKNIEEFENLLKDNLGKHSVPAPPDVWSGVSSSIAGNSGSVFSQFTSYFSSFSNIVKVAFFVGGISAAGIVLYKDNTQVKTTDTPTIPAIENAESSDDASTKPNNSKSETFPLNTDAKQANKQRSSTNTSENINQHLKANQVPLQPYLNNNPSNGEQTRSGQTTPSPESANRPNIILNNQVVLSNNKPCVGENITLSNTQNQKGDWYINGKKINSSKSAINYVWANADNTLIEFKHDSNTVRKSITSAVTNAKIVSVNPSQDSYIFNLDNAEVIANWYVNGNLIITNSKQLKYNFDEVGMQHIKAVPVNHACSSPVETHITIKPKGDIKTYTIFTPNGDGKNDTYIVEISNYETYSIQIFNSQNVKVFASNNPAISWDGTEFNSGKECSNGEYAAKIAYKLIGEKSTIKNIKLTLIRN